LTGGNGGGDDRDDNDDAQNNNKCLASAQKYTDSAAPRGPNSKYTKLSQK